MRPKKELQALWPSIARAAAVSGQSTDKLMSAFERGAREQTELQDLQAVLGSSRRARRASARATRLFASGSAPVEFNSRRVRGRRGKRTQAAAAVERKERKLTKAARQDAQRAQRQIEWVKANELQGKPLKFIPHELWCQVRAICLDHTGACSRHWLRWCTNKYLAAQVRRCALIPSDDGVTYHYDWGHQRARDVVAVAAILYSMRRAVRNRKTWSSVTTGVCRNLILEALEPREKHRKSAGYLTGVYGWGGRWSSTPFARGTRVGPGCGIITALEQVGVVKRTRQRTQGYATSSGYQPNQYWIASPIPEYDSDLVPALERIDLVVTEVAIQEAEARQHRPSPFDLYAAGPEPPPVTH